jgi:hypothetical protein
MRCTLVYFMYPAVVNCQDAIRLLGEAIVISRMMQKTSSLSFTRITFTELPTPNRLCPVRRVT